MPDSLRAMALSLAAERAAAKGGARSDVAPAKKKRAGRRQSEASRRVEELMRRLMDESSSDQARIAAAKLLLEVEGLVEKESDDARRHRDDEYEAALAEAQALLAEFAAAKLASLQCAGAVDHDGAAAAADAAGSAPVAAGA